MANGNDCWQPSAGDAFLSEATTFDGETKANVTRLVPHGLTPYAPASDPQVGAILAVAELRLKSKGDPALAIRGPRCWDDPPGTLRRAALVMKFKSLHKHVFIYLVICGLSCDL